MAEANRIRQHGLDLRNRGILGGVEAFVGGVQDDRKMRESRRRADADDARQNRSESRADRALAMREAEMLENAQERQAYDTDALTTLQDVSDRVGIEFAQTGEVAPETAQRLQQTTDLLGGPQRAQERIVQRASDSG